MRHRHGGGGAEQAWWNKRDMGSADVPARRQSMGTGLGHEARGSHGAWNLFTLFSENILLRVVWVQPQGCKMAHFQGLLRLLEAPWLKNHWLKNGPKNLI